MDPLLFKEFGDAGELHLVYEGPLVSFEFLGTLAIELQRIFEKVTWREVRYIWPYPLPEIWYWYTHAPERVSPQLNRFSRILNIAPHAAWRTLLHRGNFLLCSWR